jgi:hypothetical protein
MERQLPLPKSVIYFELWLTWTLVKVPVLIGDFSHAIMIAVPISLKSELLTATWALQSYMYIVQYELSQKPRGTRRRTRRRGERENNGGYEDG